ncbi:MAG: bifunctional metallophosphatase/5'-nucleotidase [Chloroflexi bacterium]|nr:bifunctional metallophosphatase/5'-nucleotidase [Chloroflexota bacterium]
MELVILHSNDTHGHLLPIPTPSGETLGGYARRSTFVKRQRARHPNLLLLDAGDLYQGSRFWHAFHGAPDIQLMNLLEYDAVTLGNHDTDKGSELLAERINEARFSWLSANMTFPDDHVLFDQWRPFVIKAFEGVRVGIFGLTVDAMELFPEDFRDHVTVMQEVEAAAKMVDILRDQVDLLVMLSHLGHIGDCAVAESVSGIDVIIGGHSHTPLERVHEVNETPIVRAIVGTTQMGKLTFLAAPGRRALLQSYELIPIDDTYENDPIVAAEVERWVEQLPPTTVLGQLATALDTRTEVKTLAESTAGNFFADALKYYFSDEVDLTFVHMGTVRGDRIYGPGDFTNHDLSEYHPFDNPPMLMEINAPQLKVILERGVSDLPRAVGVFLSHAGLKVTVDPSRQPQVIDQDRPRLKTHGQRVLSAEFNGQAVDFRDASQTFRVAMDGYMGRGGAGYRIVRAARNVRQAPLGAGRIIEQYLRECSPVSTDLGGRIIFANDSEANANGRG